MKLRVCIITKNESRCIARCISSVLPCADEVLVSDTGSSDDTVTIARSFGAKVTFQTWENDFSLARNRLLDEAGDGGWILFIDADEYLKEGSSKFLRKYIEKHDKNTSVDAFWIYHTNLESGGVPGETMPMQRVFRASAQTRFTGVIHEVLRKNGQPLRSEIIPSDKVILIHDGYAGARSREKAERNIALLTKPGAVDEASRLYHLGKAYFSVGREEDALNCYLEYLKTDSGASPVTLSAIINTLHLARRLCYDNQIIYLNDLALNRFPKHPTAHLLYGDRLFSENRLDDALEAYKSAFELKVPEFDFSSNMPDSIIHRARLRCAHISYIKGAPDDALSFLADTKIDSDPSGLALAVRCLARRGAEESAKWLDGIIPTDSAEPLRLLLDTIYEFSGGVLFLIYFERYYKLCGFRDSRFPIMQAIVAEYTAAVSELDRLCCERYPFASDDETSRAFLSPHDFTLYDTLRQRMLAAALLSCNEQEISFCRHRFGMNVSAAIDLALGHDVSKLPDSAFECCLGVFGEMLRFCGLNGAAKVWLEVLLLFGGSARLKAAETLDFAGLSNDALELLLSARDEDLTKDELFAALRISVREGHGELARDCASLADSRGCGGALFDQFRQWAQIM